MKQRLNVFFAIGKFFIQYFTVSVTSLLETNKHMDLNIFLIHDFDSDLLLEILAFTKKKYDVEIQLIYQDSKIFDSYRIADHVSLNTYLRLLLADIIPKDIDNGLFLDSDTIITGPLTELASFNFSTTTASDDMGCKYLAAVREIPEQNESNSKRITELGFHTNSYFNAGVLLVNLKNWRTDNISAKLIEMASSYMDDLVFWDQDVLNMFFLNKWDELDSKFNALNMIWKRKKPPLIIHFAGSSKPWNYLNRHPYKSFYFKYLLLTPYKNIKYTDFSYSKIPYKYYRDLRHFVNYYRQSCLGNINKKVYHD
ncbi:glycosyltransferase family 8 protein [Mucilaginibacter sp.]|uniref:glycosyltransferase family 8 protein n=1 Tax=Mucilaginibacter sp. TaxID=1882438 RepID=UPI003D0B7068